MSATTTKTNFRAKTFCNIRKHELFIFEGLRYLKISARVGLSETGKCKEFIDSKMVHVEK